jgi:hypothetical protein
MPTDFEPSYTHSSHVQGTNDGSAAPPVHGLMPSPLPGVLGHAIHADLSTTEFEAKLSREIAELWGVHSASKDDVRRTRSQLKAHRRDLGERLHALKSILVHTGRGGGWAPYLRSQKLPLATADRYVAEHEATLAPSEEKLLDEELSTPTVEEVLQVARKSLPKLCRLLTTAELVYAFVHEIVWNIPNVEGRDPAEGIEVFRTSHEEVPWVEL